MDVWEFALETSSSEMELEQTMIRNGYADSTMSEITEMCGVDEGQGLISSPYLDMQTKARMFDVMSEMVEILG